MGSVFQYQYQDSANDRSARRRRRLVGRLRNVCPHLVELELVKNDAGRPALHYLFAFETEPATLAWCCMRCGLQVSENAVQVLRRSLERSLGHDFSGTTKSLLEAQGKTTKLIEKVNRLGGAP